MAAVACFGLKLLLCSNSQLTFAADQQRQPSLRVGQTNNSGRSRGSNLAGLAGQGRTGSGSGSDSGSGFGFGWGELG